MRKGLGRRALRAFVGALILVTTVTSAALAAESPELVRTGIGEGRPAAVTLWASLDRTAIAPYLEHARRAAVAAAAARAHPVHPAHPAHPALPARKVATHHVRAAIAKTTTLVRNHLWIPALGISRAVYSFPCSRSTEPSNYVYRWGCAGRNNVYLFGHAYGVFKALHDAYYNGTLKVGMVATYADGNGHITHYRVTTWQVVKPSDVSWAGSLRTPSMTLQTCVGGHSQYRLDVRLVSY